MSELLSFLSNPVSSVISAIGGVIQNSQNAKENKKNREWSEKMWNLNNEYNTPSSVLGRFQDAGIGVNPNYLVTGSYNGGLSSYSGNADTSRSMENPLKNFHLGYNEAKQVQNETELKDSTILTNNSIQEKNEADANKANQEAEVAKKTAEYKTTENKYQESNIILDLAHKGLENSVLELTRDYTKDANPLQLNILREQVEQAKAEKRIKENTANLILEQINTQIAETALVKEQKNTEKTKQTANISSAHASEASAKASVASANYYSELAQTEKTLRPAQLQKVENESLNLLRDLRVKDSNINLNETQAKMLIINGIIANRKYELDRYIATVRDEFGTNTATIVQNYVKAVAYSAKNRVNNFFWKVKGKHGAGARW